MAYCHNLPILQRIRYHHYHNSFTSTKVHVGQLKYLNAVILGAGPGEQPSGAYVFRPAAGSNNPQAIASTATISVINVRITVSIFNHRLFRDHW